MMKLADIMIWHTGGQLQSMMVVFHQIIFHGLNKTFVLRLKNFKLKDS